METAVKAEIPNPTSILGPRYNKPILVPGQLVREYPEFQWPHEDDQFVDFQVLSNVVMGEPEFFQRYVNNHLLDDEKHLVTEYHPCFAETDEVVEAHMRTPMLEFGDTGIRCFLVAFRNAFGLLMVGEDESVEIIRRAIGMDVEVSSMHCKMQFMRFTDEAIVKFDLAGDVAELYATSQIHLPPIRVNFAKYNDSNES